MRKMNKKAFKPIDQEEKDLMESIEREEWEPVDKISQDEPVPYPAHRG